MSFFKMKIGLFFALACTLSVSSFGGHAFSDELCQGFGPQAPRDIANRAGSNVQALSPAPAASQMNLCNMHVHTNAENKGPGFSIFAGDGKHGGFKCNGTDALTQAELEDPADGDGAFEGVKPGDTIEVHWVYTSCDVAPGEGLEACSNDKCANPQLRVEGQAFLVVNDPNALDFGAFVYDGNIVNGLHQPKSLPSETGTPVVFAGSTTGPKFTQNICSPITATWSVRPQCAKLDISSLYRWAEQGNVFDEEHAHGVRQLVIAPELLAPIQ